MQNAWVLNQEIQINPELYHPWVECLISAQAASVRSPAGA